MSKSKDKRIYEVLGVFLLILAAAIIRNTYLLQYEVRLPYYRIPILDAAYYDAWAVRVAQGKGYGPMPFYMAPLYPYVLALIYKVFQHNLTIVYFFHEMLGVLNVFLVYLLGRRLFGHVVGLIAGLMITVYAPVVYLESKLLTETLAITLGLGSLLMLMRAIDRSTILRFLGTGLMLGLSALCRPAALLTAVFMALWLLWRKPVKGRLVAVLAAGIALAILPVTARNYFVGKDVALISTNGGICFAQANASLATGVSSTIGGFTSSLATQQQEEMELASRGVGHQVTASESAAFWFKFGLRMAKEHPGRFALLQLKKLVWSLHNREPGCSYSVYFEQTLVPALHYLFMPFSVLAGLGLFGFIRSRRNKEAELLAIQVISVYVTMIVFAMSSRYRVPAMPIMAIFAGFGIVQAVSKHQASSVTHYALRITGMLACLAAVSAVSLVKYPQPLILPSDTGNLGTAYMDSGDLDKAIYYLDKTLKMEPSSFAHFNLANALFAKDRLDEAVLHYRKAVKLRPDDRRFQAALGYALLKQRESKGHS
ncbi:MAG TPA: glycosyltransferase family 39 protein [Armatimonadota bacterium]|nr:glycosyltransferase family 39 protein [Armatimonadota bacterium]